MLHRKYTVVVMKIVQMHDIIIIHRFHKYLNCCHNCSNQLVASLVELKNYCSHQLPNNEARENHFYFAKHSIDDTRLGLITPLTMHSFTSFNAIWLNNILLINATSKVYCGCNVDCSNARHYHHSSIP